jgi:hypothetical protein
MHFSEEVELLNEEMQQVLAFLDWKAGCWEEREMECVWVLAAVVTVGETTTPTMPVMLEGALKEGLQAYALHQAAIRQNLFT